MGATRRLLATKMIQVKLPGGVIKEIPATQGKHKIPSQGLMYTVIVYVVGGDVEYEIVGATT